MKTTTLGVSSLLSTRLAYGCWRLPGTMNPSEVKPEAEAKGRRAVIAALEAGYNLFDNADIYCCGHAERIFGEALRQVPGMREKIIIATKCGICFPGGSEATDQRHYDFSAAHIVRSCEESLQRMQVETVDLYQLHRPDFLADPEEVAAAFSQLRQSGKARYFGVSNFRPSLITALQSACPMPLIVHQVEISLAKLDCFTDGTLDQCLIEKMTPLAWTPLANVFKGDGGKTSSPDRANGVLSVLNSIARARGVSSSVVALAWLLKHPSKIVPIIGSTNPERIRDAVKADDVELTREEWYQLLVAARGEPVP
ncbi:MAG: aldo/keto reductase [Verrucomicrobiota bacterium]|jgi:predicted oxidoreductase